MIKRALLAFNKDMFKKSVDTNMFFYIVEGIRADDTNEKNLNKVRFRALFLENYAIKGL